MSFVANFSRFWIVNWGFSTGALIFLSLSVFHHALIRLFFDPEQPSFEPHVYFEITIYLLLLSVFYLLWCWCPSQSPTSSWRVLRWIADKRCSAHNFYASNGFFCKLMFFSVCVILLWNFHFLVSVSEQFIKHERRPFISVLETTEQLDWIALINNFVTVVVHERQMILAAKGWELMAYIATAIYHSWFWISDYKSKNRILNEIGNKPGKWTVNLFIVLAVVGLVAVTVVHLVILWFYTTNSTTKLLSGPISLILLILVYYLFCRIDKAVVAHAETEQYKTDFALGLQYIDQPVRAIFWILFLYSLFTTWGGHFEAAEIFFSGAIAFEMLLSCYSWAKTKTV